MTRVKHVIVVGGGIAGIATAVMLARHDVRVTLLESRRRLGGRASSFVDAATGELLDNGQHVTMGCCHAYMKLLEMLGMSETVAWFDRQHWIEAGGRRSVLEPHRMLAWLPGPAAFAPAMAGARFLSWREKLEVARALTHMLTIDRRDVVRTTFAAWLLEQGQSASTIAKFWTPIIVSACNLDPRDVAASSAMHVFQDGLAGGADAARIGVSRVPLGSLYDGVEALLTARGGGLCLGCSATEVGARSVATHQGAMHADAVVCALPPERVRAVVAKSEQVDDPRFAALSQLTHSAIVCAHVELAEGQIDVPQAVLLGTTSQWVFRKDEQGRRLSVVISAAGDVVGFSDAQLGSLIEQDLRACFPEQGLRMGRCRGVRERFATFAATPAWEARRPATLGPRGVDGIVLAGDYVKTGWPATMESATISGFAAAAAVLGACMEPYVR